MKDNIPIFKESAGLRIDKFLATNIPNQSRVQWQQHIESGEVKLNGNLIKANYRIREGDLIEISLSDEDEPVLHAVPMILDIIYEDAWLAIINKPKGISVHPGHGTNEVTLAHGLLHQFPQLSTVLGEDRPGIVHRLDKDTAGLLVIAKDDETHDALSKAFQCREVYKGYSAIVHGKYDEPKSFNEPMGRHPVKRTKIAVLAEGKEALTYIFPKKTNGIYSLIKVDIVTGRTHQIRVHLAHDHHPVVGDSVYGPKKSHASDLMLASTTLGFKHPHTREYRSFSIPMPEHMKNFCSRIG